MPFPVLVSGSEAPPALSPLHVPFLVEHSRKSWEAAAGFGRGPTARKKHFSFFFLFVAVAVSNMQNDAGEVVDLYIPQKCSATHRLITAADHASVQITVGNVDENGLYTNQNTSFALSGAVRSRAQGDSALNRLCVEGGIIKNI